MLDVHFHPNHIDPNRLIGSTVIIVDVLRATTTITHAIEHCAVAIEIFVTPAEARARAQGLVSGTFLLGGERGGVVIDGFHLGNSPAEYTRETVAGKMLLFTTTNGTAAALHASRAERVLFGCFANLSAVASVLEESDCPLHILCAGTDGVPTLEDGLFAGALCAALQHAHSREMTDNARLAMAAFEQLATSADGHNQRSINTASLVSAMRSSHGGCNLIDLNLANDVVIAAQVDSCATVGELEIPTRTIRALRPSHRFMGV